MRPYRHHENNDLQASYPADTQATRNQEDELAWLGIAAAALLLSCGAGGFVLALASQVVNVEKVIEIIKGSL
jgi:hypothetical protein